MESVVKILREQNRYTQTRLAQILGISRPALINYENMEQDLPLFVVKELSKLFNVSYDCLIDNKLPDSEPGDDKETLLLEDLLSSLETCRPEERNTALKLLSVYLGSLK